MKNILLLLMLYALFSSCATTNKMANEAFHYALVGQNETKIYSRLGPPARTIPTPDKGKILVYEFYNKGMFVTPYKSKVTYSAKKNVLSDREGFTFKSGVNTVTNDPRYTIYQKDMSYLKVFLNEQGNCVRFEENLTRDQLEMFYKQFKRYVPRDR